MDIDERNILVCVLWSQKVAVAAVFTLRVPLYQTRLPG